MFILRLTQTLNNEILDLNDLLNDLRTEHPIFVVGSGRSGTNLIRNILDKHKNIYGIKEETCLFKHKDESHRYLEKFEKDKDFEKLSISLLVILTYGTDCLGPFLRSNIFPADILNDFNEIKKLDCFSLLQNKLEVFNLCAKYLTLKANKRRWVEKTPGNIFSVDLILEIYPNAKFIEIYRDPRAIYCSWENNEHPFFKNSNIIECIDLWNFAIKTGEKLQKHGSRYFRLKYEDLISHPKEELMKVCNFLDEEFDEKMLDITVVKSSFEDVKDQTGFSNIPVNRWKNNLTKNELLFIDLATKKHRKQLNYPDSPIRLSFFNFFPLIIFLINDFIEGGRNYHFFNNFTDRLLSVIRRRVSYLRNIKQLVRRNKKIKSYLTNHKIKKLQLGSGPTILKDWLNTDLNPRSNEVILLDSTKTFPFKDKTFDYIFSEHHIEHLTYKEGLFMLNECYRVLKPGGKIRIATPNLKTFLDLYTPTKTSIQERYIRFIVDYFLPDTKIYKDVFVINNTFKNFGHKFIYDEATLRDVLEKTGFIATTTFLPNESNDENLRNVEIHGKHYIASGLKDGEELNKFETMVLEATRP